MLVVAIRNPHIPQKKEAVSMPIIQCLDSHVADLIAAGEVVERPASVATLFLKQSKK